MHTIIAALDALRELGDRIKQVSTVTLAEKKQMLTINIHSLEIGKALADMLSTKMATDFDCNDSCLLTAEERSMSRNPNNRIAVIKKIRERTGLGLKEAKDMHDDYMLSTGMMYRDFDSTLKWKKAE